MKITADDRLVAVAARERAAREQSPAAAIELDDGTIITGHSSPLLGACAAMLINAIKHLANIDHAIKLISQKYIEPIQYTKINLLHGNNPRLHTDEVLLALSMLSLTDENCQNALEKLPLLRGCQVHTTTMLGEVDLKIFKKLGIDVTSDPQPKKTV